MNSNANVVTGRKVRLGVIGAGAWATASHLPNLQTRSDEVDFVAVCRKGERELNEIAEEFGFDVASEDYRDVLGAGIDLCIVSSPLSFHYEHARAALEAGCHVLLEKPVTIRSDHAWELVDVAKENDRHLVLAFGWNYMPTYLRAQEVWGEEGIGEIEHVMVHMASGIRELLSGTSVSSTGDPEDEADTRTWTDPSLSGGGYGQAQLPHALAWLMGLSGLRAESVFALGGGPSSAPVELHNALAVRFRGGASGTISGASYHGGAQGNRHQLQIRLFGTEGQLHADLERDRLWIWRPDGSREVDLPKDAGTYHCEGPPLVLLDLVLGREVENRSPMELGARTVETLEAAYSSMRKAEPVSVEGSETG